MKIRKSTEKDSEAVHRLLQEYNAPYMTKSSDFSFCIEEDEKILGGIVAESLFDTVEVEYLCVKPELRGQGLGRRLIGLVEQKAREAGMRRILLNTYSFQAPEFYRKLGYQQLFEISPAYQNYAQYYFMKLL